MNCITCQERPAYARSRCMRCYQRARRGDEIPIAKQLSRAGCNWTEEERMILRSELGVTPVRTLAQKLRRTMRAVRSEAERNRLSAELIAKRSAGLSFTDVCTYLGVDRKSLFWWMKRGLITANKRDATVADGCRREVWTFSYDEVERFLRDGGALYVMRPVAGWEDVYTEAKAALLSRLISRRDVICLCCLTDGSMYRWRQKGFPQPVVTGTRGEMFYDRAAVRTWLDAHPHYWTKAARRGI